MDKAITDKEKYESFDSVPFPVVVTDAKGKVIFKNKLTYKLKIINTNKNIKLLLEDNQYEQFVKASTEKISLIIKCKSVSGVSHAAIVPTDDDELIVCFTVCSFSIQKIMNCSSFELLQETYKATDSAFKAYAELCEKYKRETAPNTAEILQWNKLRFARGQKNWLMYIHSLIRDEDFEKSATHDLRSIGDKLCEYFSGKIAPLGFRLSIKYDDAFYPTKIQKNTFVTIFLELCATAFMLSFDGRCNIRFYKQEGNIFIEYTFTSKDNELIKTNYGIETTFAKAITDYCKWHLSGIQFFDDTARFCFSVPEVYESGTVLRSPDLSQNFHRDEDIEIFNMVLSRLFFME